MQLFSRTNVNMKKKLLEILNSILKSCQVTIQVRAREMGLNCPMHIYILVSHLLTPGRVHLWGFSRYACPQDEGFSTYMD